MGRLFLPGLVVSAENQGTFSDYHDCNGDHGSAVDTVFGCDDCYPDEAGIFHDNDIGAIHIQTGSRLSKN